MLQSANERVDNSLFRLAYQRFRVLENQICTRDQIRLELDGASDSSGFGTWQT